MDNQPKHHIAVLKELYHSPDGIADTRTLAERTGFTQGVVHSLGRVLVSRGFATKQIRLVPLHNFHNGKMKKAFWKINERNLKQIIIILKENYPND